MVGVRRGERGQVAPLLALLAVAAGLACLGLGRLGAEAVELATARTAADAAALAGAGGAEGDARELAGANGAVLERFDQAAADARVRVRIGDAPATARARAVGGGGPAGTMGQGGLAPALRAAIARAEGVLGTPIPITSGFRSRAEQTRLYDRRATNPYPVAPPGSSMHERGLAIDVPAAFAERLAAIAGVSGLCRPYPRTDPVHFELCPAPSGRSPASR